MTPTTTTRGGCGRGVIIRRILSLIPSLLASPARDLDMDLAAKVAREAKDMDIRTLSLNPTGLNLSQQASMDGTPNLSLSGITLNTSPSQNHQERAARARREAEDMDMAAREVRDPDIRTLSLNLKLTGQSLSLTGQSLSLTGLRLSLIGITLTSIPSQNHQARVARAQREAGDMDMAAREVRDPDIRTLSLNHRLSLTGPNPSLSLIGMETDTAGCNFCRYC